MKGNFGPFLLVALVVVVVVASAPFPLLIRSARKKKRRGEKPDRIEGVIFIVDSVQQG